MTLKVTRRVYAGGCRVATVHIVIALVNVYAFRTVRLCALVARLAPAVVPARHIDTLRSRVPAPMQPRRTLVQVLFAGRPNEAHATRAEIWSHTLAAVETTVLTHS